MKLLIQNYSSESTTEPLYINECVNRSEVGTSVIWGDKSVSTYDMFDKASPDLFITHYTLVSQDMIKYLSSSKIDVVLNITGAEQKHVDMIEEVLSTNKIKCPLLFTNKPNGVNEILQRKTKLVSIMHGADPFLKNQKIDAPNYKIEAGIFCDYPPDKNIRDAADPYGTYHFLSSTTHLVNDVDICLPIVHLNGLYEKYDKFIVSTGDMNIPQHFFDALLYGNQAFLHCRKKTHNDKMREVLSVLSPKKSLLYGEENNINFNSVRNNIIVKHTAVSRVQRLFGRLSQSGMVDSLHKVAKEISNDHSRP